MKTVVLTLLSVAVLAVLGAAAFIASGMFNVAASEPHWPITTWVLETARTRSIQAHAAGIAAPADYQDPARLAGAVGHFADHCAGCHGNPGAAKGPVSEGMYPQPPDLTRAAERYTPSELFWILKHGIKMSGMPSMADDGDTMLWSTVAFIEKLPTLSAEDYNDLWMQSQAEAGGMDHGAMPMAGAAAVDHHAKAP